ncbi:interferon regulatory factor 4-like isoform X2 [Mixophyes fleayi]|uniref:interferon regulatory factor 4-like isoform X2 n=1 Tax=Mixophyes fleayi TaxID=3061075 RepID=UPI003F4E1106
MCEKGSQPLRLKEWLILQIDSGKYQGLRWENEEKTMFRIPWKHAAKQNYRKQEDAALFKAWTMYKEEGNKEASKSPRKESSSRFPEEQKTVLMEDQKTEGPLDTQISSKLPGLESQKNLIEIGSFAGPVTWRNQHIDHKETNIPETAVIIPPSSSSSDFWLHVRLYYQDKLVTEVTTQTAEGCRIVPLSSSQSDYSLCPPVPLEEIPLPSPEEVPGSLSPDVHVALKKLLLHLDKGVLLWVAPEGVFVKRQCQVRVYWSGPLALHTDRPNKLEREKTCKVLDTERFMHELQMYVMCNGPDPRYQIQLCFGEEFPESTVNPKKLITAHVEPVFARELLVKLNTKQMKNLPNH